MENKTNCPTCGVELVQSMGNSNGESCLSCVPHKEESNHVEVVDKIEVGLRLLFAIVFGFVFAGLAYGAGAVIWSGVGVILALVCFPVGFGYGFFIQEINFFIRELFRAFLPFD